MSSRDIKAIVGRGTAEVIVEEEFLRLLEIGKPLRIKYGVDPSRPDLHLGHAVCFRKLRQLQNLGHKMVVIVGDWTAQIGDPSGVSSTRAMLSAEEVRANADTYMKQFFKVVDEKRTEIAWQSQWYGDFALDDVIRLTSRFTVAQMLARDDFAKRHGEGQPIAITEFLYPLLQAYDSVAIEADVELGGTDQKFNLLLARELQQAVGQQPQQVFLVPILIGTDGKMKMSKSQDNYIAVEDVPNEMYGKVMSIPDDLILQYFELVTDVSDEELGEFRRGLGAQSVNPMVLKQRLAHEIVAQFHNAGAAQAAEEYFNRVFRQREAPEEMTEVRVSYQAIKQQALQKQRLARTNAELEEAMVTEAGGAEPGTGRLRPEMVSMPIVLLVDLINGKLPRPLTASRSETRRLFQQGAIEVNGNTLTDPDVAIRLPTATLRIGKRRYVRLVVDMDDR